MAATNLAQRTEKLIEETMASLEREGFDLDALVVPDDPDSQTLRRAVRMSAMMLMISEHLNAIGASIGEAGRQKAWDAFATGGLVFPPKDAP